MNRARERVRDDVSLVSEVARAVSNALGLSSANRTLGRNIVIAALDAHIAATANATATIGTASEVTSEDINNDEAGSAVDAGADTAPDGGQGAFVKAAKTYGPLGDSMLSDVFRKVTTRLRGAMVQMQAMQREDAGDEDEEGDEEAGGGGVTGFGKAERLSGFGVGGALKGGLVKKHTFQVRWSVYLVEVVVVVVLVVIAVVIV